MKSLIAKGMIFSFLFVGCSEPVNQTGGESVDRRPTRSYLALGDSYTSGEGVEPALRWPVQLVNLLRANEVKVADPVIVAATGWTTNELDREIDAIAADSEFDLVTLLIGVNDQYRGQPADQYRVEFRALLDRAVKLARGEPARVVVVSIPDWGVTPFAERRDRELIAREIDELNQINREAAESIGAHWVDVTSFSREVGGRGPMTADDGLHPAGMQYSEWARLILPSARKAITGN